MPPSTLSALLAPGQRVSVSTGPDDRHTAALVVDDASGRIRLQLLGDPAPSQFADSVIDLEWATELELASATTRVTAITEDGLIVANAPVDVVQRRDYARLYVRLPVRIRHGDTTVEGETADISEGGMRARVAPLHVAAGAQVACTVELYDHVIDLRADVVRTEQRSSQETELAVEFTGGYPADAIRRFVFTEQLRRRRSKTERFDG